MDIIKLIEKIRHPKFNPVQNIKKHYKMKRFQKYASVGKNFSICCRANCYADAPGRISIGDNCEIYGSLQSMCDGTITIGNHTAIYERSFVGCVEKVSIGNYVAISNNVHIFDNNNHPIDPEIRKQMCIDGFHTDAWRWEYSDHAPVVIEDKVWIGERATILKGVTIGEGSVIGCNSVVTKDIPPYCIAAGNPARVVKKIEH